MCRLFFIFKPFFFCVVYCIYYSSTATAFKISISLKSSVLQFHTNLQLQPLKLSPLNGLLKDSYSKIEFNTNDNVKLEILHLPASNQNYINDINQFIEINLKTNQRLLPSLVFIPGSYHSAWCFADKFMPYFSSKGYDCYTLSLRGTSPSPLSNHIKSIQIEKHIKDVTDVLDSLFNSSRIDKDTMSSSLPQAISPVLISHSFGGMVTMKALEDEAFREKISAVVLMCSVPPSGNAPMISRFMKSKFLDSLKIVWGFVFKGITYDKKLCREILFDDSVDDADIIRFMEHFREDSKVSADIAKLRNILPSKTCIHADGSGRAAWLGNDNTATPLRLVMGAARDYIVDEEGVQETAKYLGTTAVIVEGASHDLMLGPLYSRAADKIQDWLEENINIS